VPGTGGVRYEPGHDGRLEAPSLGWHSAAVPRPLRDATPGLHHVTVGATGFELYFTDENDRMMWIRLLVLMLDKYGWTCVLMCQMTTHLHLIVSVPDESLPLGMHSLNAAYSRGFNADHGRRGYLVRSRYWSKPIRSDAQLLVTYRYSARNPVRAGACIRAEDWRWSSVATSCGLARDFPFADATCVLQQFGRSPQATPALLAYLGAGE
jgi:REP element-mobilizing transposase RayT